jgi:hypothetical protein
LCLRGSFLKSASVPVTVRFCCGSRFSLLVGLLGIRTYENPSPAGPKGEKI